MSLWHEATKEDLSIDEESKELHICFDSNYSGAIYVSIPLEDVKDFLKEVEG